MPRNSQGKRQKYCSKSCKYKVQRLRDKELNNARFKKGGYPRQTILRVWMRSRAADHTVPCFYCGTRLDASSFCIEHKKAVKFLKNRSEYLQEDNLCISCHSCNNRKGVMSAEKFLKEKGN